MIDHIKLQFVIINDIRKTLNQQPKTLRTTNQKHGSIKQ